MIPLFSGATKQLIAAHKYKSAETHHYDTVISLLSSRLVRISIVDKQAQALVKTVYLPYLYKLTQMVQKDFNLKQWEIYKLEPFIIEESDKLTLIMFIFIVDLADTLYTYKYEVENILDENIDYRMKKVDCLSQRPWLVSGLLLKENLIFTDTQTIDTVNGFILYIDYSDKKIAGKNVRGVQLLISDQDKQQFLQHHPDITLPSDELTVVNCYDNKHPVLYRLPDQAEKAQFQFTNGLLYVRFTEPDQILHEKFKI